MSIKTEVTISSKDVLSNLTTGIIKGEVEVIDLAQPLNENTPMLKLPEPFKNTSGFKYIQISNYDEDGPAWYWNDFIAGEHCGTHFDAPCHWISGKGKETVDTLDVNKLIGEACIIDVRKQCEEDPDYLLSVSDILAWEEQYGKIPDHSWVILQSGWDQYVEDEAKYLNVGEDGMSHSPGMSVETSKFLITERNILGFGVETVGTDAGNAATFEPAFPTHYYLSQEGKFGLTQLGNIDKLPTRGSVIITTPLKITNGSGSPVRPIALVPKK